MRQVLWVLLSALLMWASFPPLNWAFLIFVAPAPFLWALRRVRTAREAGWLGFLFGAAFWGPLLVWIAVIGMVAWIPLTIVMAVWGTGYALVVYLARGWSSWRWWSAAVGSWALWEFLRARYPFGGFPWGSAGHPVGSLAWPRGAAQWIGATGWGVVVIAIAAGIVITFDDERDRRPLEVSVGFAVALTLLGALFSPNANGPEARVAIVQGNSPCPRVHCETEKLRIYTSHLSLTSELPDDSLDLVVWGEDSFGGEYNPTFNADVQSAIGAEARRLGAYLLAGGTRQDRREPGTFDNVNIVFDDSGQIVGEYMKRHPVPFGEYVPFRNLLQFIPQLDQVPNDMNRGTSPVVFPISLPEGDGRFGSVISFEGAFARTIRSEVKAGAQLIVVATNEGSYGRGSASDQLIGMVRLMAPALGVDIVHAAVTGRSALIRADGSIEGITDLFVEDVLQGALNLQTSRRTLYAMVGDWLQLLAIVGALYVYTSSLGGVSREFRIRAQRRR